MDTFATTQHYDEIRKLIAQLSMEEQLRLIGEISSSLQKRFSAQAPTSASQTEHMGKVRGKYADVPTSSNRFAERKQQEIELER